MRTIYMTKGSCVVKFELRLIYVYVRLAIVDKINIENTICVTE